MPDPAWEGYPVDAMDGAAAGHVEGVFLDAESDDPAWLVVKPGRFSREVVVPFGDCAAVVGRVWVPFPWEMLHRAPVIDPSRQLTREQELALCAHFGIVPDQGRAGEVSGRPPGSITSFPRASSG